MDLGVVDWDNTLFPTTAINELEVDLDVPNEGLTAVLTGIDTAISAFLLELLGFCGKVVIVTNGTDQWIRKCLKFLPLSREIVEHNPNSKELDPRVQVVSARDLFHTEGDEKQYSEWKHNAFQMLVNDHLPQSPKSFNSNDDDIDKKYRIISFGDGDSEEIAMHSLVSDERILLIVKFASEPTMNELLTELAFVKDNMRHYISVTANETIELESLLF